MQVPESGGSSLSNEYVFFAFFFPVLLHLTGCTAETNLKETLTIKQTEENWHGKI